MSQRPYQCNNCDSAFVQIIHLKYLYVHTDDRPFLVTNDKLISGCHMGLPTNRKLVGGFNLKFYNFFHH